MHKVLHYRVNCFVGRGGKEGAVEKCRPCKGTGRQVQIHQIAPGMVQQIQSVCSECRGDGERINPKLRCKTCEGKKVIRERKVMEVHIDKGMIYHYEVVSMKQVLSVNENCSVE